MAKRKTKAELVAENEEFMAQREAEEFATWPSRLMAVLERATQTPNWFDLKVRDSKFHLTKERDAFEFPLVHTMRAQIDLESLTWDLDMLDEDRRKAAERAEARAAALAKLTPFERELLDL